jgi:hypothetical protein
VEPSPEEPAPPHPPPAPEPGELPAPPSTTGELGLELRRESSTGDAREGAAPERAPRVSRTWAIVLGMLVIVAVTAAAGYVILRGSGANLLAMMPADVELVAVAYLDPAADQKVNLLRMGEGLPSMPTQGQVGARVRSVLDGLLEGAGLRADDVLSWIGGEAALAVDVRDGEVETAFIAAVRDMDRARSMLARLGTPGSPWSDLTWHDRDHLGVTVRVARSGSGREVAYAFDDDVLIIADTQAFLERILATREGSGEQLIATAAFQQVEAGLPDGRLFIGFAEPAPLLGALDRGFLSYGVPRLLGLGDPSALQAVGWSVSAEPGGLTLDIMIEHHAAQLSAPLRDVFALPERENELVAYVPADAWGVYAAHGLDVGLRSLVDAMRVEDPERAIELQRAGLAGIGGLFEQTAGDVALVLSGSGRQGTGVALLVSVHDPRRSAEALSTAMRTIVADASVRAALGVQDAVSQRERGVRWVTMTHAGTVITWAKGADPPLAYAVRDRTVITGTSRREVMAILDTMEGEPGLLDEASFIRSPGVVPAADALLYVDVGDAAEAVRRTRALRGTLHLDGEMVADLRRFRAIAMGLDATEWRQQARFQVSRR